ncbi:MAG: hypothetical protein V4692_03555, partial [Bdellovibrionota bacterium]
MKKLILVMILACGTSSVASAQSCDDILKPSICVKVISISGTEMSAKCVGETANGESHGFDCTELLSNSPEFGLGDTNRLFPSFWSPCRANDRFPSAQTCEPRFAGYVAHGRVKCELSPLPPVSLPKPSGICQQDPRHPMCAGSKAK